MLLSQSTAQQSSSYADMAELADALASGASRGNPVKVQVLLSAFIKFHIVLYADMAELADALASGASRGNPVKVQVLLSAFLFFFLLHLHTPAVTWHFM